MPSKLFSRFVLSIYAGTGKCRHGFIRACDTSSCAQCCVAYVSRLARKRCNHQGILDHKITGSSGYGAFMLPSCTCTRCIAANLTGYHRVKHFYLSLSQYQFAGTALPGGKDVLPDGRTSCISLSQAGVPAHPKQERTYLLSTKAYSCTAICDEFTCSSAAA